jgi:L-asparaginase
MIATGGTIACCETAHGLSPALDSAALLGALPELSALCTVETLDLMQLDSTDVTAADRQRMAQAVWQNREKFDGFVLTHGTDTLEETAYLLDLVHNSEKPVCLTGAMRSAAEISPDGPVNLLCAVRTAASSEARGKGVLVVMNEEIHAAREVVKSHSANTETFVSPFWGPLGYVDPDRVVFRRNTLGRQSIRPPELVEDVHLIKLASGSDSLLIDFLVERNVRGLVLEAFGRGNVPPAALPGIRRAVEKGIPVVITTRTIAGRVLDVYGYEGGAKTVLEAGGILGGETSGPKARLKLMLALGVASGRDELAVFFDTP